MSQIPPSALRSQAILSLINDNNICMAPNPASRAYERQTTSIPLSICSLCQLLMSAARSSPSLSYVWHLCLFLCLLPLFSPPSHFHSLALCSQKEVNNVSYQLSLSVLLEREERETERKPRKRQKRYEGGAQKRRKQRHRGGERGREGLRQKAWIAEISLDHCLTLWMRLFN